MPIPGTRETTVAAAVLIDVVRYPERAGVPIDVVCRAIGTETRVLDDSHARLPGSLMERLWEQAALLTRDEHL
ncbi:MAG: hypothetical protein JWN34_2399, partial [Bryobacterales bacterium]|nr:hypothetical protein [Bryobacterales bacterium]